MVIMAAASEAYGTSEPLPATDSDPEVSVEEETAEQPKAEGFTASLELLLPACLLLGAFLAGIVCYSLFNLGIRRRLGRKENLLPTASGSYASKVQVSPLGKDTNGGGEGGEGGDGGGNVAFLSCDDLNILHRMERMPYSLRRLLVMSLPSLLSLSFLPVALFLYQPLTRWFWPPSVFPTPPNINDAISCFLIPAGLVYAIAFGFAFQEASGLQMAYRKWIVGYVSNLEQIVFLLDELQPIDQCEKRRIVHIMKDDLMRALARILVDHAGHRQDTFSNKRASILEALQPLMRLQRRNHELEPADIDLIELIKNRIFAQQPLGGEIGAQQSNLNLFQWIFLELLGYFSFFGILLLEAHSYYMQLMMCVITVLTISMFSYVLADLDRPFHGIFRVRLQTLRSAVDLLTSAHDTSMEGDNKAFD